MVERALRTAGDPLVPENNGDQALRQGLREKLGYVEGEVLTRLGI